MTEILTLALAYRAAGLAVIPLQPRTKRPAGSLLPLDTTSATAAPKRSWKPYQHTPPTEAEIRGWFTTSPHLNLGIVCGAVSGGLVVIDIESRELFAQWQASVEPLLPPDIWAHLPIVLSGKGTHIYVRTAHSVGNRRLAVRTDNGTSQVLAETRGDGGYITAPPSVHPSGAIYTLHQGSLTDIPHLCDEHFQMLLAAAEALAPPVPPQSGREVIARFNAAHPIAEMLQHYGYHPVAVGRFIRPGGDTASVSVIGERSYHHNTNDPLNREKNGCLWGQTAFDLFCHFDHQQSFAQALKAAALATGVTLSPPEEPVTAERTGLNHYWKNAAGMWWGDKQICNFSAQIVGEERYHTVPPQVNYLIHVQSATNTHTVRILAEEFEKESAVATLFATLGHWARRNVTLRPSVVLDAMKFFSTSTDIRDIYPHTGWVQGRYLMSNGYVDADGWHPIPAQGLPSGLESYAFHPGTGSLRDGLAAFDCLLHAAPDAITIPLVGGVLLSPLFALLKTAPPLIHLYGTTGHRKTHLACAALSLWGTFMPGHPPLSWSSTSASIQDLGWHLKDAPLLIDDLKRSLAGPHKLSFVIQNYGDGTGRQRLDHDIRLRPVKPMRCVLLSTGERIPEREAAHLARMLVLPVGPEDVSNSHLDQLLAQQSNLHTLSVAFLQWLAQTKLDSAEWQRRFQQVRITIRQEYDTLPHLINPDRTASNVALVLTAWEVFAAFLQAHDLWSPEQCRAWRTRCLDIARDLGHAHQQLTASEHPGAAFLDSITTLIASGRYRLAPKTAPPLADATQPLLGVYDDEAVYLFPEYACMAVNTLWQADSSERCSERDIGLWLKHQHRLLKADPNSHKYRIRYGSARPYTWCLRHETIGFSTIAESPPCDDDA